MKKQPQIIFIAITLIQVILKLKIGISQNNELSALVTNSIIFMATNFFTYKISKMLLKNNLCSAVTIVFNGFAIISLESFLNNSIYELSNLIFTIIIYCNIKLWRRTQLNLKYILLFSISLILGEVINKYFFVCVIPINIIYIIKCIKNKKYRKLIKYQISIILSSIIGIILNYIIINSKITLSVRDIDILTNVKSYFYLINKGFFNSLFIPIFIIYILFIHKKVNKTAKNSAIFLLTFTIIFYSIFTIIFAPSIEVKSLIPIYSITTILIVYIFKMYLFKFFKRNEALFLIVITFAVIVYSPMVQGISLELKAESDLITNTVSKQNNN